VPTYVVEIEWPLSGTDVGQRFVPSAVVRDEDDTGTPPPANTHKVNFALFHTPNNTTNTPKLPTRDSADIDPATEPTVVPNGGTMLETDVIGSHKLVATLIKLSDGSTEDTDEELDINITVSGPQRREISGIIIEE
jgi:hypothetical protein